MQIFVTFICEIEVFGSKGLGVNLTYMFIYNCDYKVIVKIIIVGLPHMG